MKRTHQLLEVILLSLGQLTLDDLKRDLLFQDAGMTDLLLELPHQLEVDLVV